MKYLALALALIVSPAKAHEFLSPQGGYLCNPKASSSACAVLRKREAAGPVRLDGWYKAAYSILAASPKACVVAGSDTQVVIFAMAAGSGRGRNGYSPWNGIEPDNADYARWMKRSAWGRRIYAQAKADGWLTRPEPHTLDAADLIALGVPGCR